MTHPRGRESGNPLNEVTQPGVTPRSDTLTMRLDLKPDGGGLRSLHSLPRISLVYQQMPGLLLLESQRPSHGGDPSFCMGLARCLLTLESVVPKGTMQLGQPVPEGPQDSGIPEP